MKLIYPIVVVIITAALVISVNAKEYSYTIEDTSGNLIESEWGTFVNELPESMRNEIMDIDPYSPEDALDGVKEKTGFKYWLVKIGEETSCAVSAMFPDLIPILSLLLILGATQLLLPPTSGETANAFNMLGQLVFSIAIFKTTFSMLNLAQDYLTKICGLMNILTPVMQAVYLAQGSLTQMSVSATSVMIAVTIIGFINTVIMAPCTRILFTLSAVSSVCNEVGLAGFTSAIRRTIMRIWQVVTIMFSFMLGTQSIIARSADTLAAKTVKFAIGSFIPMAGGVMAEAYNTVKEGISFVRITTGIGGIILILLLILPGIIPLIVYKISVVILSGVAGIMKLDGADGLLNEVKGIIEIMTSIVLYTSLMLIFAIILFTRSQVT